MNEWDIFRLEYGDGNCRVIGREFFQAVQKFIKKNKVYLISSLNFAGLPLDFLNQFDKEKDEFNINSRIAWYLYMAATNVYDPNLTSPFGALYTFLIRRGLTIIKIQPKNFIKLPVKT